jgi:hypothetical protein
MSLNRFVATINPTFTEASCKQHDNNLWFDAHTKQQAIAICQQCPEQELCRQYALTLPVDTDGIYAGLTAAQLKPLRKQNGNPPVINHGTKAGYESHRRYGIKPCESCLQANARYSYQRNKEFKARQRQKKTVPSNFEHGTASGYTKHYLHGIPVCEDCKKAKAVYMRQRYTKK